MRFGIIGTGRITRRLVADLQSTDGVEVTAIASRTAERAKWYADQYGIATAVSGYAELLKRDDIDAVYISLPPSMHCEWTLAAASAGKHVLCEKPLGVNAKEALAMMDACHSAGVRLLDATGWLHHPRTNAFADWLTAGEFGAIGHISAAVSFYQPFQSGDHRLDPELGGGCILDLGWYACGVVRFAMQQLPQSVVAEAVFRDGVPQRATAILRFDNDVSASVSCGYDTATRKWFEVAGSGSSLICDDFTRPWHDRPPRCWIHDASGSVQSHSYAGNQERRMISRFIGDESISALQQQCYQTQQILDAINRSISENERVEMQDIVGA